MESLGDILRRVTVRHTTLPEDIKANSDTASEANTCTLCNGAGWVRLEVPLEHSSFGRAMPCTCQNQKQAKQRIARFQQYANLGPLSRFTFESLGNKSPNHQEEILHGQLQETTIKAGMDYADNPRGWFVISGPSGSGKTRLAVAIATRRLEQGYPAFFTTAPDLLDHLRATYAPTAEFTYDEFFDQVRNTALLVLDDLGAHALTPWAQEKLYQLFNHRSGAGTPTVITLRGPLEGLDPYLQSRLLDPLLSQVHRLEVGTPPLLQHLGTLPKEQLKRQTFETFDMRGTHITIEELETLKRAFQAAQSFAKSPEGWLVLHGGVGCGKTHLAVSIVNRCLEAKRSAFYATVPHLLDYLRDAFAPNVDVSYQTRLDQVRHASLLVLDDLGTQSPTPWANEKLYQLLVHRHNARLATVITTNRTLGDLPEAVASRLKDFSLVNEVAINAPDYRDRGRHRSRSRNQG